MSGRSFGGKYRAALVGAGAPENAPAAGSMSARGRAGYSFWQRFWASFIGVDLPVRSKEAARDDAGFAASAPVPGGPRDGPLTDAELDALLRRLEDAAAGLAPAGMSAQTPGVSAVVSVVPDGAATFGVSLRLIPAPGRRLSLPLTVALVADRTYFVAGVSADGIGTFRYVPAGAWSLRRISRPAPGLPAPGVDATQDQASPSGQGGNSPVALPAPRTGDWLAAASTTRSGVLVMVLPEARLVLHRGPGDVFLLEVLVAELDQTPLIVTVRYGTTSGAARDLVIPVAGKGALARLSGYSPSAAWEASAVSVSSRLHGWDPERIAPSVRAAANNATRRAWRAISEFAPAEIRDLIEAELG